LKNNYIGIRIDSQLKRQIDTYLSAHPKSQLSEVVRDALNAYFSKDIEEHELVTLNVQRLVKQVEQLKDLQNLQMDLLSFYIRNWLAYQHETPEEIKDATWQSSEFRYAKFLKSFSKFLKDDGQSIEKFILSHLENANDVNKK